MLKPTMIPKHTHGQKKIRSNPKTIGSLWRILGNKLKNLKANTLKRKTQTFILSFLYITYHGVTKGKIVSDSKGENENETN